MSLPPFKVVLDANVLFPPLLRDVLLRAAEKELYQPYWSAKIMSELEHALVRERLLTPEKAKDLRAQIERAFPEAQVEGFEHLEAVMPNHPGDRHVAAAATLIGAQVIVSANVRDFAGLPPGLEPQTPDTFLVNLFDLAPAALETVLKEISADYQRPPQSLDQLLTRLDLVAPNFRRALSRRLGLEA